MAARTSRSLIEVVLFAKSNMKWALRSNQPSCQPLNYTDMAPAIS